MGMDEEEFPVYTMVGIVSNGGTYVHIATINFPMVHMSVSRNNIGRFKRIYTQSIINDIDIRLGHAIHFNAFCKCCARRW